MSGRQDEFLHSLEASSYHHVHAPSIIVPNSHLRYPLPSVTMSEEDDDEAAEEAVEVDPC